MNNDDYDDVVDIKDDIHTYTHQFRSKEKKSIVN